MALKDFLKERLTARGRSAADMSRDIGVSESAISRWLNGQSEPEFEQCLRFSDYVGIDPRDMFERSKRGEEFRKLYEKFAKNPKSKRAEWAPEIEFKSDAEKILVKQLLYILRTDPGGVGDLAEKWLIQLSQLTEMKRQGSNPKAKAANKGGKKETDRLQKTGTP